MAEGKRLNCNRCPSFCCKMAGDVQVSRNDRRRLAKHLGMSLPDFEAKHVVKRPRNPDLFIKLAYETCPFLGEDRRCTVYEARPKDCRGYVCWDQHDMTVYEFAAFTQLSTRTMRRLEREAED